MFYVARCINGGFQTSLTFRGALDNLTLLGPDAAVFTWSGKWVAGRRIVGA